MEVVIGWRMRLLVLSASAALVSGCFLERSGTGLEDGGGGGGVDSGPSTDGGGASMDAGPGPSDDAGRRDAGGPIGDDAGRPDAGGCADGTVDLDGDPTNGCECTVATQQCVGGDEDCDGSIDEGCGCSPVGTSEPCGMTDVGECELGTRTCAAGGVWGACEGAVLPETEECNGLDDDCDGVTDTLSRTCGTNMGVCTEGTQFCSSGSWGDCTGIGPGTETCDLGRLDEDCDGTANEGCECDGAERGRCMVLTCNGTRFCDGSGSWGDCTIDPTIVEICDGRDTDCNGVVDDGAATCALDSGCDFVRLASGTYLFCHQGGGGGVRAEWADARDHCDVFGYHLATVDDSAEDTALTSEAHARSSGDWWIGIHDLDDDGRFRWQGPASSYDDWRGGHPRDGECGAIDTGRGEWETHDCGGDRRFICEAPVP